MENELDYVERKEILLFFYCKMVVLFTFFLKKA